MKNIALLLTAFSALTFSSCTSNPNADKSSNSEQHADAPTKDSKIPFEEAKNYFVKNTVPASANGVHKIDTQAQFDEFFGPAAGMGEKAMPTAIDFNTHFVIGIISPETDKALEDVHIGLTQKDNKIQVAYHEHYGKQNSYSIRSSSILIVDKKYEAPVEAIETDHNH